MIRLRTLPWAWLAFAAAAVSLAPNSLGAAADGTGLPAAAAGPVDFARDIKPILETSCLKCHAHGQKKGGYQIDSREWFVKGGESGPAAQPGRSAESLVVRLVSGLDPDRVMPAKGARLTPGQIGLLRAWIDQGLPWADDVELGRGLEARLEPRRVELPPARGAGTNPVDRLLAPDLARLNVSWGKPVPDRLFARRVYLDVIGLLPSPEELEAFERDRGRDKRVRLVQRLLSDHQRYAEHWMTFWNDALRNDYRGTGFIDGGRKQITPWLYAALATNLPFDRFVARLVNPDEHSEGFSKGIVWRGVVNASQTPPVQAAQNLSQVFLGINLKCASCHDSFISNWKLADAYGLASVYAEAPLELVRCDKPTGETAQRRFLFPQLGAVADSTNRAERLESLARLMTSPQNGRLTRTMVNRLWAKFLGRGLVEPVDEMDNPPWNPDLLDWLASDLADHGYDLKRTMALILTSRAYQMPAVSGEEQISDRFGFRGPLVKRLSAEQYLDGLSALTGVWQQQPANGEVDFSVHLGASRPSSTARWIWAAPGAAQGAPPQTIYLRKELELTEVPEQAVVVVAADNRFTLFVNGRDAGSGDDWNKPRLIDVRKHLVVGRNVIAVSATNGSSKEGDASPNPAGLIVEAHFFSRQPAAPLAAARRRSRSAEARPPGPPGRVRTVAFVSDRTWLCSTNKAEGWQQPAFAASGWTAAAELGGPDTSPWALGHRLMVAASQAEQFGRVRAVLANADPLSAALGRPNREQVVTSRSPVATTMQALELTNGSTLADWLRRGAEEMVNAPNPAPADLVRRLYRQGISRDPTSAELELARQTVGSPPSREGVEDFLWSLSLLPEFQLVY